MRNFGVHVPFDITPEKRHELIKPVWDDIVCEALQDLKEYRRRRTLNFMDKIPAQQDAGEVGLIDDLDM